MAEHTPYQKKIIQRYYDNIDAIAVQKLGELVSELYLTVEGKKADKLWDRVRAAMTNLKVPDKLANHIVGQRDVELLAKNLQEWSKAGR